MDTPLMQRPPRDPTLQAYIDNTILLESGFMHGGALMPHASTSPNPRPMEKESLGDLREEFEASTGPIRDQCPHALWMVFWSKRYKASPEKGMCVEPERLWWLAQSGDTVLLSDRVTHHYTTIGNVDRDAGRIGFLDPWPDDFFLQAGRNVLGISSDHLTISREEFEQVTVGVLTWDKTDLLNTYFDVFPDAETAEQRYRAGYCIMAAGPESLCSLAVKHFIAAMRLADEAGDDEFALQAAARAWLAGLCASARAQLNNELLAVELLDKMLELPSRRAPAIDLLRRLNKFELARLANSAGQIEQYQMVEAATGIAIEQDPEFEDAYWLRAIARNTTNPPAAVVDARQALSLNASAIATLEAEVERLGARPPGSGGPTRAKLMERLHRRVTTLETLAAAAARSGDLTTARDAIREVLTLTPNRVDALHKLLVLEQALGEREGIIFAATALLSQVAPEEVHALARQALEDADQ